MRHILVERARRQGTLKRGGTARRVRMPESRIITPTTDVDILVLDEALQEFAKHHSEKAELVNLHHFAGLSIPDAAVALRVSRATAERWWAFARAWLYDRLKDSTLLDGP
jgi:RNA polymerase sigma factor (TIGR02999 family)